MTFARWTLLMWLLAVVASIVFAARMKPQTSIEGLLDPSDPSVAAMGRVLDRFPATEEMLVMVSLRDGQTDPEPLVQFAARLERALASSETVARVQYRAGDEMRSFIQKVVVPSGLDYLDDAERAELLSRLTPEGMRIQLQRQRDAMAAPGPAAGEVAKQLARDPLRLYEFLERRASQFAPPGLGGGDLFFSPAGRDLLIRINGTQPPRDIDFCKRITADITQTADRVNTDQFEIRITGAYAIAAWSATKIRADSIEGTIATTVGLFLLLILFLRRPLLHSMLMLVPTIVGIAVGFGCYALLTTEMTPLAAVVGGALGGIGIDYSIQFLARYVEERRTAASNLAAVRTTIRGYSGPLLAAWLTTLIGFASIAFSPIRLLRDFSLLGGLALLGSFAATLTLLPALLVLFDRRSLPTMSRGSSMLRSLSIQLARRPLPWATGMGVVTAIALVLAIAGASRWGMESDLTVLHPRPNPPLDAQSDISARMGVAAGSVFVYVRGETPQQLLERAYALDRRLNDPAVRSAGVTARFGLPSLLPDPDAAARLRDELDPALAARVGDDFRSALQSSGFNPSRFEPYIGFLERLVTPATPPDVDTLVQFPAWARIVLSKEALAGKPPTEAISFVFFSRPLDERAFRTGALDALRHATAGLEGVTLTGLAPITQDVERAVKRDFLRLFAVAFTLVILYLIIYFRSMSLALIAMIPTAFSLCILAAYISLAGHKLNLVNIVMLPLLLGVNVDYGIYAAAASRVSRSRLRLTKQFTTTIPAVILSCAATVIGFGSMVLTSLPAVKLLGSLIIVGITACLAGTMLLTWPLLMHSLRRSRGRGRRHT